MAVLSSQCQQIILLLLEIEEVSELARGHLAIRPDDDEHAWSAELT